MAVEQTWALQNTTINAVTFRQMLQALTGTGGGVIPGTVAGSISNSKPIDLLVAQQSTPNMTVQVNPGQAVMAGTQLSAPSTSYNWTPQGSYYALNDAATSVTIATADPVNPRIDVVYIAAQDSFYSGSNNQSLIGVITGTAAPSPSAPTAPNNSIVLAQVNVAANAASIVNANIVDQRTFASSLTQATAQGVASIAGNTFGTGVVGTVGVSSITSQTGPTFSISGGTKLVVADTGTYLATVKTTWSASVGSGRSFVQLLRASDSTILGRASLGPSEDTTSVTVQAVLPATGDGVLVQAMQSSGGTLNITGTLTMTKLAR